MHNDESTMTEGENLRMQGKESGKIRGLTFAEKDIEYSVFNDLAIFEGDIVLGTKAQMAEIKRQIENPKPKTRGAIIVGQRYRWPKGVVPYSFSSGFIGKEKVLEAINHYHQKTNIKFVKRTRETDYLNFIAGDGLWSYVGKQGRKQDLCLAGNWIIGNAIHEMGHAIGLWHEQSREDRDKFVEIRYQNIDPQAIHNFNQHVTDGDDIGEYDFGSIMHYPTYAFSTNGQPTIVPLKSGVPIGQRNSLSSEDIEAVNLMYKR
jgi:hypothetical protein